MESYMVCYLFIPIPLGARFIVNFPILARVEHSLNSVARTGP